MRRRNFLQTSMAGACGFVFLPGLEVSNPSCGPAFPDVKDVTRRVSEFVAGVEYGDLPSELIELGKKSILDGLGLALAGSAARSGKIVRAYLQQLGFRGGDATVAGS